MASVKAEKASSDKRLVEAVLERKPYQAATEEARALAWARLSAEISSSTAKRYNAEKRFRQISTRAEREKMDAGVADQCCRILSEVSVANRQLRASKRDGDRPLAAHRLDEEEETKDSEIHTQPHKKRRVTKPQSRHVIEEKERAEWEERDQVVSDENQENKPNDDDEDDVPVLTVGTNGSSVDTSATHGGLPTTAVTTGTAVPMLRTLAEWRMVDEELKASRRDTELVAKHVMESQRRRHALLGLTASEWI